MIRDCNLPFGVAPKRTEEDIGKEVIAELQRQGFETYQEVSLGYSSQRADVVGVHGRVTAVVECKAQLSLRLLDQLARWLGLAHLVIGAVERGRVGPAARWYCRSKGIGVWIVGFHEVTVLESPRLFRRADDARLRASLWPEHQTGEFATAGSMGGGYFTPFKRTVQALQRVVKDRPGIELREALRAIEHHYANDKSALSAIPPLLRKGVIAGIRIEVTSRRLKLFVAE